MNQEKVISLFCLISGMDDNQGEKYSSFIARAITTTLNQMKDKSLAGDYEDALCYVCACRAYYNYVCALASQNGGNFTAGDVSISADFKERLNSAKELLSDAVSSCSALFLDQGFIFSTIEEEEK